jgi:hypothetical protein
MGPYLPNLHNLADLAVTWAIGLVLVLGGTAVVGRRLPPEIRLGVGWGAYALVMTLWGVATPWTLAVPAGGFVVFAIGSATLPQRRLAREDWLSLLRLLAISLPFFLAMAPVRPAEPDTWLNLLPNAVYLVDHGFLPMAGRPDAHSFLPAAPYNTQFLAYLGGLAEPDFPPGGMSLLNLLLLVAAGGLIGRCVIPPREREPLGWGAAALGLLLATGLNPGFVPRIHLSAYGETGLAVTVLMAGWLLVELARRDAAGAAKRDALLATGLVLAAMVEVKQSGFGMVAAAAFGAGLPALLARRIGALKDLSMALVAPVALFFVWRGFVAAAGLDELKPLPFSQWQWSNLPAILGAIGHTIAAKGFYFALVAAAILALPWLAMRRRETGMLGFHAALFLGYFVFLLLTYVGHFPGAWSTEAHSFFRYETQLSLVLVLALALAVRDLGFAGAIRGARVAVARRGVIGLALAAPIAAAPLALRFDLAMPQPLVWRLAGNLVPYLHDGDRLALLLPGDNGSVATMLSGVLNDVEPKRRDLDVLVRDRADEDALAEAAARGYPLALVSCTPDGLMGLPANVAVLLRMDAGLWRAVAEWPYPPGVTEARWQQILAWPPLCRKR